MKISLNTFFYDNFGQPEIRNRAKTVAGQEMGSLMKNLRVLVVSVLNSLKFMKEISLAV